MFLFVLMMFGMFLFTGITMAITPYISRKEILFGVSIPHQLKKEGEQTIVVFTDFRHKSLIVSNGLFIGISLLIILMTILIPVFLYNQIPEQIPTHWGMQGADRFAEKSIGAFVTMPLIQLGVMLIMVYANYSLKVAKQRISPKRPKVSVEQNRAYRYAMSKYTVTLGICTLLLFLMIQCFMVFAVHNTTYFIIMMVPFLILALGGVLYIAVKYGQGGERYTPREEKEILQRNEAFDDDEHWKLGIIYFNPGDPAIWVEKRFGLGMTLNMGRWQSWAVILGIIVITIVISVVPLFLV